MGRSSSSTPVSLPVETQAGVILTAHGAGISHAYGGALSALSVTYTLTPNALNTLGEKIWTETEVVKALYLDREVVLAQDEREVVGDFD